MKQLKLDDIHDRVTRIEDSRSGYNEKAAQWESMWKLHAHKESALAALKDNREQVTLSTPYDVVNLAMRMFPEKPIIEVPEENVSETKDLAASARQKFLLGLWDRSNREQGSTILSDAVWWGCVRGRFVFDIRWVYDSLPKRLQARRCPIMVRTLDPLNVGISRGPNYTEYAYHKYEDTRANIQQRFNNKERGTWYTIKRECDPYEEVEVVDFWYIDAEDGGVYNAIVVEDQFVKKCYLTDYPDIPIVESGFDRAPLHDEEDKYHGILHTLNGNWQYQCRLASQMATAILWNYWPMVVAQNEYGRELGNPRVGPGEVWVVPGGTQVDMVNYNVNAPLGEAMMSLMAANEQRSTFPQVMYGQAPGEVQAGFGVSLLADAARGRVNGLRQNLEWAMSVVNEIALGLVENLGDDLEDGVTVWGYNEAADQMQHAVLYPEDVAGYYENHVRLELDVPADDIQQQTLGLRQVEQRILSERSYRKKLMKMPLPDDEEDRIRLEQAEKTDPVFAALRKNVAVEEYLQMENYRQAALKYLEAMGDIPPEELERMQMMRQMQMEQQQQAMAQQQQQMDVANQATNPQMQGGPPPGMQPQAMGTESLPPQMQGQMTEDMFQGLPPELYQQIVNGRVPNAVPTMDELRGEV